MVFPVVSEPAMTRGPGRQGRRWAREPVLRTRTAEFTLNAQEYALLVEAARQAGMARRAYVATVVRTAPRTAPQPAAGTRWNRS